MTFDLDANRKTRRVADHPFEFIAGAISAPPHFEYPPIYPLRNVSRVRLGVKDKWI
jgi:hypothetical protein